MASNDDRVVPISKASGEVIPDDELVEIFETLDESEAMVIKGLLESEGIPALAASREVPQMVFPSIGGVVVRVRGDQAEEARRIIEENRSGDASELSEPSDGGPIDAA